VYNRQFANSKLKYGKAFVRSLLVTQPAQLVICAHINLLLPAWLIANAWRTQLALITHGIDAWQPTPSWTTNLLAVRIDHLLAVSRFTADRFRSWAPVAEERVFVIPNSVDLNIFTPGPKSDHLLSRYGLRSNQVLMTMGRLAAAEKYKGFDEVLELMPRLLAEFPDVKYLIVGDGPDKARLEQKARDIGVAKEVIFAGKIDEREKTQHFRLADIYVMPSSGEGFGIVLIEAAACGIPIIGSKADGSREALLQGELGKLIDPGQPEEIYGAIRAIFRSKPAVTRHAKVACFGVESFDNNVKKWISHVGLTGV
jgi:phosphatidyl-myo-inositol dimannoside synthase